jgi:hypothetical protein
MDGACSTNKGEEEYVGKPERKRPLGRPGRRWVDNIKMDLCVVCVPPNLFVFYEVRIALKKSR